MKYRRKNKLIFDKRINFNRISFNKINFNFKKINFKKINFKQLQLKNKKNAFILIGILIVFLLFFLISKLINKTSIVIKTEDKPKIEKIQIVEPLFLEKLDVKVYKVDLEKEYGINLNKSKEEIIIKNTKPITNNENNKYLEIEIVPKNKGISQWKEEDLILENIFLHEDSINIEN